MKSDISKIITEAVRLTFRNKWLWVFGLLLSSSLSFQQLSNLDFGDDKEKELGIQDGTQGVALPSLTVVNPLVKALSEVPWYFYASLVVVMGAVILINLSIMVYTRFFALGGLIVGIDASSRNEKLSLSEMSAAGRKKVFELIKLGTYPILFLTLAVIFAALPFLLLISSSPGSRYILIFLLGLLIALVFLIAAVLIAASSGLGKVALILEDLNWKAAFLKGYRLLNKYFVDVIVLGIVGCVVNVLASLVSCLILIPAALMLFGGVFAVRELPSLTYVLMPVGGLLILLIFGVLTLIQTVLVVFNQSTWVLLYKQLTEEAVYAAE